MVPNCPEVDWKAEVERLQAIIDGSDVGTWEWNVQTGETRFNERWANIVGFTLAEISPTTIETWQRFAHPEDLAASEHLLQEHFAGRSEYYHCEARMQHKSGHWVWVRDHGKVITWTADGKPEWMAGSHMDITREKKERLDAERLSKIAKSIPGFIYEFELTDDGLMSFPYASPGIKSVYGVSVEDAMTSADMVLAAIHPEDLERVTDSITNSAKLMEPWWAEYRVLVDGKVRWMYGFSKPERQPGKTSWYGLIIDSTETKEIELELERSQGRLRHAQTMAKLGHWEADIETGSLFWSEQIFDIFGFDQKRFKPTVEAFYNAVHPDDRHLVRASEDNAKATGIHDVEHRIIRPDGEIRWVREYANFSPNANDVGKVILIGTVQDITDRKELELLLYQQSNTDVLTKLHNRRFAMNFMEKKFEQLNRRADDKVDCSAISFDIDHFKQVNDTYGHAMGDEVLKCVAESVKRILRETDIFARVGGEEFLIILPGMELEGAAQLAERVRHLIEALSINLRTDTVRVTASLAVASCSMRDTTLDDFLVRLDNGLYQGKREGRNRVVIVSTD